MLRLSFETAAVGRSFVDPFHGRSSALGLLIRSVDLFSSLPFVVDICSIRYPN